MNDLRSLWGHHILNGDDSTVGDGMNLMALKPSQWKRLEHDLISPATQQDFLEGLLAYLSSVALDDGVDTDRLYVTAVKTENVGAWSPSHINQQKLPVIKTLISRNSRC
jgi:hypothetical protein